MIVNYRATLEFSSGLSDDISCLGVLFLTPRENDTRHNPQGLVIHDNLHHAEKNLKRTNKASFQGLTALAKKDWDPKLSYSSCFSLCKNHSIQKNLTGLDSFFVACFHFVSLFTLAQAKNRPSKIFLQNQAQSSFLDWTVLPKWKARQISIF